MSLYAELASAAAEAQTILAPICDPSAAGDFTLSDRTGTFVGTFNEFDAQDPLDVSGIRTIRLLTILATRDQFDTPPVSAPRTSLTAKGATWLVTSVTDMPFHYRLTCRPT